MIRRNQIIQVCCLTLLLFLGLLCGSITYGRYRATVAQEVSFLAKTPQESGTFQIISPNGWQPADGGMVLDFTLSAEENTHPQGEACLRLTATEGLSPNVQINLTVNEMTYRATPQAIQEGSVLYNRMGGGYEFRFYDANGELYWQANAAETMHLSVQGASDQALIRLIAQEK